MRLYELVLVLRPSVAEADRKKLLETIKSWLKDAKMTAEEAWGSKALKYPIKHELTGFYHHFLFETPTIAADFEKKILENDNILRHLLVRKK